MFDETIEKSMIDSKSLMENQTFDGFSKVGAHVKKAVHIHVHVLYEFCARTCSVHLQILQKKVNKDPMNHVRVLIVCCVSSSFSKHAFVFPKACFLAPSTRPIS